MMEAVSTSVTLVKFYETIQHNIPEYSYFHTVAVRTLSPTMFRLEEHQLFWDKRYIWPSKIETLIKKTHHLRKEIKTRSLFWETARSICWKTRLVYQKICVCNGLSCGLMVGLYVLLRAIALRPQQTQKVKSQFRTVSFSFHATWVRILRFYFYSVSSKTGLSQRFS
jgi:hypothetical protein